MNAAALSAQIRAKRLAALGAGVIDGPELTADCDAIAQAVVEHLTSAAVVTTPPGVAVQVAPISGTGATIAPGVGSIS